MNADSEHTASLLQEWNERRATLKSFVDINRKRKAREISSILPGAAPVSEQRSRFFGGQSEGPGLGGSEAVPWESSSVESRIDAICRSIRDEGGNVASVFNDPQFLSCLVQYYPGFEAYARVVQARTSG